jgi:hypothetical protein
MTEIWILLFLVGSSFLISGTKAFLGKERHGDRTHPGVAVLLIIIGGGLFFLMGRRLLVDFLR